MATGINTAYYCHAGCRLREEAGPDTYTPSLTRMPRCQAKSLRRKSCPICFCYPHLHSTVHICHNFNIFRSHGFSSKHNKCTQQLKNCYIPSQTNFKRYFLYIHAKAFVLHEFWQMANLFLSCWLLNMRSGFDM